MSRWFEKDLARETGDPFGYQPKQRPGLEDACRGFFEAQKTIVSIGLASAGNDGSSDSLHADSLASAQNQRRRAILSIMALPSRSMADVEAKMAVLFELEDWQGCEDALFGALALSIVREAAQFLWPERMGDFGMSSRAATSTRAATRDAEDFANSISGGG